MNVCIVGASGYSGEELVKLLLDHPTVHLSRVTSRQRAGQEVATSIPKLRGRGAGLQFTDSEPRAIAADDEIDLCFLALPHGVSADYAGTLCAVGKRVIDLSADFRLDSARRYEEFYGHPHPLPQMLKTSPYVIPEICASSWRGASLIACPGCYPTSILTPLIPLVRGGIIPTENIVINSFSGVSGAGRKATESFSFSERNESATPYGIPKHFHLSEIEEQLSHAAGEAVAVQFMPHLAPMTRGIITTIVVPSGDSGIEALYDIWTEVYGTAPFVSILPSGEFPDTAHVVGTNRIDLSAVEDPRTGNFVIMSALDNLLKGAGGQAVQIMNLWYGLPETAGLP